MFIAKSYRIFFQLSHIDYFSIENEATSGREGKVVQNLPWNLLASWVIHTLLAVESVVVTSVHWLWNVHVLKA